jgi:hypothetical protein
VSTTRPGSALYQSLVGWQPTARGPLSKRLRLDDEDAYLPPLDPGPRRPWNLDDFCSPATDAVVPLAVVDRAQVPRPRRGDYPLRAVFFVLPKADAKTCQAVGLQRIATNTRLGVRDVSHSPNSCPICINPQGASGEGTNLRVHRLPLTPMRDTTPRSSSTGTGDLNADGRLILGGKVIVVDAKTAAVHVDYLTVEAKKRKSSANAYSLFVWVNRDECLGGCHFHGKLEIRNGRIILDSRSVVELRADPILALYGHALARDVFKPEHWRPRGFMRRKKEFYVSPIEGLMATEELEIKLASLTEEDVKAPCLKYKPRPEGWEHAKWTKNPIVPIWEAAEYLAEQEHLGRPAPELKRRPNPHAARGQTTIEWNPTMTFAEYNAQFCFNVIQDPSENT